MLSKTCHFIHIQIISMRKKINKCTKKLALNLTKKMLDEKQ